MSDTRYWLLVLLIPLFGVWLIGLQMGSIEVLTWLVLAVVWVVAFVMHDRIKPSTPLIAAGVVVALGVGAVVYNNATAPPKGYATVERH
jgi:hypothetical protein